MIATMATSEPRVDKVAVAIDPQSDFCASAFAGTISTLPGCGTGLSWRKNNTRWVASTLPFAWVTKTRLRSALGVEPPAARM